jgi:HTH-type transcriptional regulator / antitoxin HipB
MPPEPATSPATDPRVDALARAVRRRREALRLRQEEVADLAGCSERFVYMLERGKASVQLAKTLDVLGVLGLGLEVVVGSGVITGEHLPTESAS